MAEGGSDVSQLRKLLGDEASCPVCFEVFQEPKCLPSCAHNICLRCLEEILCNKRRSRGRFIECPVCRSRSNLPRNGIASFPTNTLLVRLIESTPGRKEEKALKTAVKVAKEALKEALECQDLLSSRSSEFESVSKQAADLKHKITKHSEKMVQSVKEQELALHTEVDKQFRDTFGFEHQHGNSDLETTKRKLSDFIKNSTACIGNVEKALNEGKVDKIIEMNRLYLNQLEGLTVAPEAPTAKSGETSSFVLKFSEGDEKIDLGKLSGSASVLDYSQSGQLIQRIDSPIQAVVRRVAVCRTTGDVAICDYENGIFIYQNTPQGFYQDWWRYDLKFGIPHDIGFSISSELIVVNSENNRLLFYNRDGKFVNQVCSNVRGVQKLKFLSVDATGRLLVTAEIKNPGYYYDDYDRDDASTVLLYGALEYNYIKGFGRRYLSDNCPRAQFHANKFYIPDRSTSSIWLFDANGDLITEVGHRNIIKSLMIDYVNDNVLMCYYFDSDIFVYKQGAVAEGYIAKIPTEARTPCYMDVTSDGKNVVVCYEDSDFFDVLSYVS